MRTTAPRAITVNLTASVRGTCGATQPGRAKICDYPSGHTEQEETFQPSRLIQPRCAGDYYGKNTREHAEHEYFHAPTIARQDWLKCQVLVVRMFIGFSFYARRDLGNIFQTSAIEWSVVNRTDSRVVGMLCTTI
ncbi:MAG TPA: hypothetical protein VF430_07280 [Verrucomicrobiae bacterium]